MFHRSLACWALKQVYKGPSRVLINSSYTKITENEYILKRRRYEKEFILMYLLLFKQLEIIITLAYHSLRIYFTVTPFTRSVKKRVGKN